MNLLKKVRQLYIETRHKIYLNKFQLVLHFLHFRIREVKRRITELGEDTFIGFYFVSHASLGTLYCLFNSDNKSHGEYFNPHFKDIEMKLQRGHI